jgi:tRNA 5-methylaminomethyl-2-thiouridine biosynthesis bifunctional protein
VNIDDLAERFARVPERGQFVLATADFGEGLDFLATWALWRRVNHQAGACLHVIAAGAEPVLSGAFFGALTARPELEPLARELAASYPPPVAGLHRLIFDHGMVRLTLCSGQTDSGWEALTSCADAWLSPVPDNTLNDGGIREPVPETGPVAVIGAGIAGCLVANNLAGRGYKVTLIDQADTLAAEASGNRQGALYVKLGVDYNDQTQLALSALMFSQRFYRRYEGKGWHQTGLLQLAYSDAEADRQARFLARNRFPETVLEPVNAQQASRIAGVPVPHPGLWFPASGWLEPGRICNALADHPGIRKQLGFAVDTLAEDPASPGNWLITSRTGETLAASGVLICAGAASPELIPLESSYRIKPIKGQITEVPENCIKAPAVVVCGPGYVNPTANGTALVGATFELHNRSPDVTRRGNRENLQMIQDLLPGTIQQADLDAVTEQATGRVAFRCTTHDYQPIAGPMKTREGNTLNGVYLFTGLGSKGLTYSPLLAEYLGDLISGQPSCLPENLIKRVDTRRCHRPLMTE